MRMSRKKPANDAPRAIEDSDLDHVNAGTRGTTDPSADSKEEFLADLRGGVATPSTGGTVTTGGRAIPAAFSSPD
jgi:hypothetical protein